MVTLSQVQSGAARYIDDEIISKIADWRKWVIGAGASIALTNTTDIFARLKASPMVQALGVIDENNMIDIDRLHGEFMKQAQKGAVTFEVPLLGALTLTSQDVDKIYHYIIGG